jgi:hypothetical protein
VIFVADVDQSDDHGVRGIAADAVTFGAEGLRFGCCDYPKARHSWRDAHPLPVA